MAAGTALRGDRGPPTCRRAIRRGGLAKLTGESNGVAMNYRHAFHAGNFADVFKHTILIGLLQALKEKPAPFCYVDTHAGAGRYDLGGSAAKKTGESADGIGRLAGLTKPPPIVRTYIDMLRSLNAGAALAGTRIYPGSPLIAATLMRADDRAILCELHPEEATQLKRLFAADRRIGVHQRDGYAALGALLPPPERRGLALIDPPFEAQDDEFHAIEAALLAAHRRWPAGIYAIWYPIKRREQTRPFHRWFVTRQIPKVLVAELLRQSDDSPLRLNGCGMIIVNPPWKFDEDLRDLLGALEPTLALDGRASVRVDWLTRELAPKAVRPGRK
jgi:23S rRNA (adenine2030-N6)-methyltransferase